jgi:hypothetical protein
MLPAEHKSCISKRVVIGRNGQGVRASDRHIEPDIHSG